MFELSLDFWTQRRRTPVVNDGDGEIDTAAVQRLQTRKKILKILETIVNRDNSHD